MRAAVLWALACALATAPASAAPVLYPRATLDELRSEPDSAELRWLWQHRQMRLGVLDREYPPLDILGTGQAYEGISADYAGLLAEQLNLEMSVHVFATFDAAVAALRAGQIDLLGAVSTGQAATAGLRLSRPYADDRPVLLARVDEARGQRFVMAMVEGYRTLAQIKAGYPQAEVQVHPGPLSALAAVGLGQADGYLGNELSGRYMLGRNPLAGVEVLGKAQLPDEDIGFASVANGSPLPRLVDAALARLTPEQHARIRERWGAMAGAAYPPVHVQLSDAEQRWLDQNPTIKVLVDEQLLPLSFRDGKAALRGLSLDVLQLISRRTGLHFDVQAGGSLKRMLEQLRKGEAQLIAGVPRSQVLERHLGFSRAYLSASRVLVTRDEPQAAVSLEQLAGQRLALVWGSAVQESLLPAHAQIQLLEVSGPVQALQAVARGQAAAAVLTLDDARPLIARWYPGRLRISASLAMPPAHFALASARGEIELQGILNKALLSLTPRETEVLVRRWRNPMIVADGAWAEHRNKVLMGFAAASALLLLALVWIRYLRRLQVQLRAAMHEADAANHAKTRFLTTMSHEIRTPLHAVLGMLELAQCKAEQGVLDRLAIEVATDAARGLLELIGDILDVTRIETGHLHLAPQRVRLREQVARVLQLFEQQARGKGLELRLQLQGPVDAEVMLDPLRFKQVLANLVSNAIKFTRQGQVEVSVRALAKGDCLAVELQVKDSGVGIAQTELAELGQLFRQASNQQQSPRCSAGLGLGISRSLCEMMGGRLFLRSVLGVGTEVDIRLNLPLLPAQEPVPALAAVVVKEGGPRLRVLVVDDYPANRLLLAQQLDYLGHQARVAEDGAQALRLWLKEHFDVVISDCHMPRLNGHALARAIRLHERRSARSACRLIGLTANAQEEERHRCRTAGMDDCLFKPLGLDSLVQALASCQTAGEQPSEEAPLLDIAHLQQLVGKDSAALNALLSDLRSSNRADLHCLERLGDTDAQGLAELAHRVKGGAKIARAAPLIAACERLERTITRTPLIAEQLQQDVAAVRDAMQRLERHLDNQAARGVTAQSH
ncbi:two-component system sensor histidine kinase EvgS [Pseudomonas hunanensis]|uniref:Two-component system sensor histidine kinase EvgS n=1 Tax=Pseudomonas hunanensis TaxID=1247546 RepID=A0ACC6K9Z2_9PSED|nr:transporter substrate-binding domain-containing protein [Pseudomonas hunanensis]MDR6715236.1 two-component system sensor histidine kinase EvgS [Pseudomonas hunanensis]